MAMSIRSMDPEDARHHPSQSIPNAAYPDARGYQPGTGGGTSPSDNDGSNTTQPQGHHYSSTAYSTTSADPSTRPWSPSPSQVHDPPPPYNPSDTDNQLFTNSSSGYAAGSSHGDGSTFGPGSSNGAMSNIPLQELPPTHNYDHQTPREQERAALYPHQRPLQSYPGHSAKPEDVEAQGQAPGEQEAMIRGQRKRKRRYMLLGGGLFAIFLLALLIGIGVGVIRKIKHGDNGDNDDDDDDDGHDYDKDDYDE